MSFGVNWGETDRVFNEINYNPKHFYRVFTLYFIDKKRAFVYIREQFGLGLMDARKVVRLFEDSYADFRLKEMLENIEEFQPEFVV